MGSGTVPPSEAMVAAAALASIQLSQGKSSEEVGLLAAFFTLLGDNLALLAIGRPNQGQ